MQMTQIGIKAQAIERGAKIYLQYCTDCHGRKGYGIVGRGPALNNPQLFGHDYFPDVSQQINLLKTETKQLVHEKDTTKISDQQRIEIDTRLNEIDQIIVDLNTKRNLAMKPAVDRGYDPKWPDRLKISNWTGTLSSFILTTLISGRPVSISYWPQAMPAYSDTARSDVVLAQYQLEDLTAYILNWDKGDDWTLDDLYAVNQFAILPIDIVTMRCEIMSCGDRWIIDPNIKPVGTDVKSIMEALKTTFGDAKRGEQLYHAQVSATLTGQNLPCTGCHRQTVNSIGPLTSGTYARIIKERLNQPQFKNYTPDQYIIESIILPERYIVPRFQNFMPKNFGREQLDIQDLADLVAYLKTQK